MRIFQKGDMDELKMSRGYFVFFATSHEQMWRAAMSSGGRWDFFLSGAWARGAWRCPSRPRAGVSVWTHSVYALLRPAQLLGICPFAASDLIVVLQTLVQAWHPGSPADEALGRLWDWGRWKDLEWKCRGFSHLGPQRREACPGRHQDRPTRPGVEKTEGKASL